MIYLVLDDLSGPAGVGLDASLHFCVLIFDFNGFITFAGTGTSKQGKTA